MEEKEDVLIRMLEIFKKSEEGISLREVIIIMNKEGYNLSDSDKNIVTHGYGRLIGSLTYGFFEKVDGVSVNMSDPRTLNPKGYKQLLDYRELKHAYKASEDARNQAIIATKQAKNALWIGIVSACVAITISLIQLYYDHPTILKNFLQ